MPKATKKAAAPPAGVRIRMYRQGLGDCFLLTFSDGQKQEHVMIDCGVFTGTAEQKNKLNQVAAHIRVTTDGRLSALVATHEHWDHVAGFHYAKDELDHLTVDRVWVAWTEDPEQTIAAENKKKTKTLSRAVRKATQKLKASNVRHDQACALALEHVIEFNGMLGAAKFSVQSDEAMSYVTKKKKAKDPFLQPGKVMFFEDWTPGGVRVFVLSPPMNRDALRQDRTAVEEGYKDEKTKQKFGAALSWAYAVLGADAGDLGEPPPPESLRPFDASLAWHKDEGLFRRYRRESWRSIENDWLQSGATLALQLDNSINNTSLVLAFELVSSGKVLLFVGDSELESWKSWIDREFKYKDGAETKKVTGRELLERTVFYKVGHHGSGNATLRAGLEAMTNKDLVAMVPTDTKFAKDKQGWDMPAPKLRPALVTQTRGRVLYADLGKKSIPAQKPDGISAERWKAFTDAVQGGGPNDLFIDYHVEE